ncbi:MAG: YciE/YciF ferroxidase family protein [Ktedonobacterales bacterium]
MQRNDQLKDKLITYLQDAEAMERQIKEILEAQVKDTQPWPQIQQRIQQHLDATETHRQRMEERLNAYNERPSTVKRAVATMMGNVVGVTAGMRTDALSKEARDDYMIEHLEIAAYELLITTASLYGDRATVAACDANLRDEVEMAHWLEQQLPHTAVLSFQQDGIQISEVETTSAEQDALTSLQQASGATGGMFQSAQDQTSAQPTI